MGARPGRVVADIPVELPRPRNHDQERTPEFQSIRDRVWDVITTWSDEVRPAGPGEPAAPRPDSTQPVEG
jgi:hypothetical protein